MSSRPISTSHPALAMVFGSITLFLFGLMIFHFGKGAARLGPRQRRERTVRRRGGTGFADRNMRQDGDIICRRRMGGQAQPPLTPAPLRGLCGSQKRRNREKRLAREQAQNPLEKRWRRGERLA